MSVAEMTRPSSVLPVCSLLCCEIKLFLVFGLFLNLMCNWPGLPRMVHVGSWYYWRREGVRSGVPGPAGTGERSWMSKLWNWRWLVGRKWDSPFY